ncbi:MAG: hypothetical protein Q4Q23_00260 [Methanobacteriaceae archaeon]|nr:hypothetical protein [Methanobacteriaceae archaeon]
MIDNNKTINCEICGTEINGEPFKTKIENSTMITCKECSKYGVVQKKPQSKKPLRNNNNFRNNSKTKQNNNNNYKRKSDVPEYEIIEDYGTVIKQAREKQKITREKLS